MSAARRKSALAKAFDGFLNDAFGPTTTVTAGGRVVKKEVPALTQISVSDRIRAAKRAQRGPTHHRSSRAAPLTSSSSANAKKVVYFYADDQPGPQLAQEDAGDDAQALLRSSSDGGGAAAASRRRRRPAVPTQAKINPRNRLLRPTVGFAAKHVDSIGLIEALNAEEEKEDEDDGGSSRSRGPTPYPASSTVKKAFRHLHEALTDAADGRSSSSSTATATAAAAAGGGTLKVSPEEFHRKAAERERLREEKLELLRRQKQREEEEAEARDARRRLQRERERTAARRQAKVVAEQMKMRSEAQRYEKQKESLALAERNKKRQKAIRAAAQRAAEKAREDKESRLYHAEEARRRKAEEEQARQEEKVRRMLEREQEKMSKAKSPKDAQLVANPINGTHSSPPGHAAPFNADDLLANTAWLDEAMDFDGGGSLRVPKKTSKSRTKVSAATRAARKKNKQKMFIQKVKRGHKQIDQLLSRATPTSVSGADTWGASPVVVGSANRIKEDVWDSIPDDRAIPTSKRQQDINLLVMQTGVSIEEAEAAYQQFDGDLVNCIVHFSSSAKPRLHTS